MHGIDPQVERESFRAKFTEKGELAALFVFTLYRRLLRVLFNYLEGV